MIVSIHQPDYIPWLGYYYKMAKSDVFVYLDDAQFSNTAAHNFNVIKTPQGVHRLKIPVRYKFGDCIKSVQTKDELDWKENHLKTLKMSYNKAPFFNDIFPKIEEVINNDYDNICELNIAINKFICDGFGIHTKVLSSSALNINTVREKRIIDICLKVGADEYLSGNGARIYQKEEDFINKGIKLTYLDYKPIKYNQLWGKFLPCMSVIDYIFNCGFDWNLVIKMLEKGNICEDNISFGK